ncbi:MAG: MerR family transcriptional regulator [Ruminococcaceae bacterium]|nr:MerR family transcriptional regulator [Oscillospiraceae bacterium]
MNQKQLYDITEVCKMLGTTSRTLRFYEEKGIIQSTTVGISSRRHYTEEQITTVRNVLVLRTLGLSVKAIAELQTKGADLKDAVLSKRAEIYASIDSRIREINLLNEALSALESGKDIFAEDWQLSSAMNEEEKEISRICTDAVLSGDADTLYEHLSPRLAEYMPRDVYRAVRKDTFAPLGDFVSIDKTVADDKFSNKLYCFARFSKLGLKITYVFHNGMIDGLWLGYYDMNAR